MKKGFLDPDVMGDLFPIIMTSLQPKIEGKIETTIQSTIAKSLVATVTVTIHEAPQKKLLQNSDKKSLDLYSINEMKKSKC